MNKPYYIGCTLPAFAAWVKTCGRKPPIVGPEVVGPRPSTPEIVIHHRIPIKK